MKHTIKDISVKIEKYCIDVDQMFNYGAKPFKNWRKNDYKDTAANFKRLLGYFADIRTNFPAASVEIIDSHIIVDYGKGSAKIKIDGMMEEILLPVVEQYFQLHKSKLAA